MNDACLLRFHGSCWQAASVQVSRPWCQPAAVRQRWISCETRHRHCRLL